MNFPTCGARPPFHTSGCLSKNPGVGVSSSLKLEFEEGGNPRLSERAKLTDQALSPPPLAQLCSTEHPISQL